MHDVLIIGGGPAGVAAGVYAARKKMKTIFVSDSVGGQSAVSAEIENWIGTVALKGYEFGQSLERHLRAQEDIDIHTGEKIVEVRETETGFEAVSDSKQAYETKSIIVATGARHRHLNVPGEEQFVGKGVVYCSTCDAPFFRGKTVAVVGGGNSGLEACQDLFPYAEKIILISNVSTLSGDSVIQKKVCENSKVSVIFNAETREIVGNAKVSGLRYFDSVIKELREIFVDGVFVEIGMVPNSDVVKPLVELTPYGEIRVDHRTCATSKPGLFAAGDVTDSVFRQNNISAGQGCIAALSAYEYIKRIT